MFPPKPKSPHLYDENRTDSGLVVMTGKVFLPGCRVLIRRSNMDTKFYNIAESLGGASPSDPHDAALELFNLCEQLESGKSMPSRHALAAMLRAIARSMM
jgi:hypothetical protein